MDSKNLDQEELDNQETDALEDVEDEAQETSTALVPVEQDWVRRHNEREEDREQIRKRVRSAKSYKEFFRPAKPKETIRDNTEKVVAVYARVSTKSTEQTSSIENQTLYYEKKVAENPNWTMQEIYSDEGKSGTSLRHRKHFKRMMENAQKQKMDLILCASVSRFARNMKDCIEQIDLLKTMHPSKPIGVYFETENIYTLDPECYQSLQMHAMLADWESANKSRRMILSYDQRILTGQYPVSDLLGFRHTKDGNLVIVPEEAKTVRFIFLARICGKGYGEIADMLTEKQRPTLKGRVEWNPMMVRNVMSNERTWGDLEARKTIVVDYKKGVVVRNSGIRDSAYVPGHHQGIVSPEIAKAARLMGPSTGKTPPVVPDISVIPSGSLKGFVNVCVGFRGVDADTLKQLCLEVYSDEEAEELRRTQAIRSGQEHSKVLSMTFSGYTVPPGIMFLNRNMPSVTIGKVGFSFNRACYDRLQCKYIDLLYHPILHSLIIRTSEESVPNSIQWVASSGKPSPLISARALSQAIFDIQGWAGELRFRLRGIAKKRGNTSFLYFDLDEPKVLERKSRKDSDVPVKECCNVEDARRTAEPETQISVESGAFGLALALRNNRDRIISEISEEDLLNHGTIMENPLIGALPSHEEIIEELEQLLMSM